MKTNRTNPFLIAAITLVGIAFTATCAFATDFTWDAVLGTAGAQDGAGAWANSAGNWLNTTDSLDDQNWANGDTNKATFGAGTAGTYGITLSGTVQAGGGIVFNTSGYSLSGTALSLQNTTVSNGVITVDNNATATINSAITYNSNKATSLVVGTGGVLNLGGGAGNSQYNFTGGGTVNMTAGTYSANTGSVAVPAFNQSGGTFNITPGNNVAYNISSATQNVNYTLSAGTLSVIGNNTTATVNNAHLGIGSGTTTAFTSTLNVQTGATINVGTTASRSGEIQIGRTAASNGTLNVSGGTLSIGTGSSVAANQIYLFKTGADAGYTATMTQSGGDVFVLGIQFGGTSGTYAPASSASLTLSGGGNLYVGTGGITRGSAAAALPVSIKLQGGTLGANGPWSSSMDMTLGTATIRAANAIGETRDITLSGKLSDDSGPGTLTKTGVGTLTLSGANLFTGATAVNGGTLALANATALSTSSGLTMADTTALSLSTASSVSSLAFANTGSMNFNVAGGGLLTVSTSNGVTHSGAASSVTINVTGVAPANGTYTLISYTGSLQGSGFSAYKLGTTPAGKSYSLFNGAGAVQLVVTDPSFWTGAQSSEWSTNVIAGSKNWTISASPADYVNGVAVVFDESATNKTVDISVADVTPGSVQFNSTSTYTLQGSNSIAGPAPVTVTAGTLRLGSANVLPDGPGTGNVTIDGTLDLNGFSETINGLSGAASGVVDNLAVGSVTLTVGNGNGSGEFTGIIQNTTGSLGIVKTGTGTQTLRGANTFSGGVTILNGTVNSRTSSTTLGSGTVTMGGVGSNGATFITGINNSNPFVINTPDSGTVVIGTNGSGSGFTMSGPVTLNGNLTIQTSTTAVGFNSNVSISGGVTGNGNLLLNNVGVGSNFINITTNPINPTGTITLQGAGTGNTNISANIGANVTGVIQNSATSILILAGTNNTYAGDTTVNAGTLRITQATDPLNANTGNDASTVTIASGAKLDLTYTGTDIVDKLFFGAAQQPAGVYSAAGVPAGATITTASFTGSGTLTVNSGPSANNYASWAALQVPPVTGGPNGDDDNDGVKNLVEYALLDGQERGTLTGTSISFVKRGNPYGGDLTYAIESSEDLGISDPWSTVTPTLDTASTISYILPNPGDNFARLKVVQVP